MSASDDSEIAVALAVLTEANPAWLALTTGMDLDLGVLGYGGGDGEDEEGKEGDGPHGCRLCVVRENIVSLC